MGYCNKEIRNAAALNGIKHWEIANALGVSEGNFCRMLRTEMPTDQKQYILSIIEKIATGEMISMDSESNRQISVIPATDSAIVGSRIKSLLEQRGMTRIELQKATSIQQTTISAFCKGSRIPNAVHIIKIANAFNVSSDYILGLSNIPQQNIDVEELRGRLSRIIDGIDKVMKECN